MNDLSFDNFFNYFDLQWVKYRNSQNIMAYVTWLMNGEIIKTYDNINTYLIQSKTNQYYD